MSQSANYRYPGIRPFTEADRRLFFGRDKDTELLRRQIIIERLLVLFGKSGLGKSSLLNAGIKPELEKKDNFLVVPLRLNINASETNSPAGIFLNAVSKWVKYDNFLWTKIAADNRLKWQNGELNESFWLACKSLQIQDKNKPIIFILDQFEELFNAKPSDVTQFGFLLSTLLHGQTPQNIQDLVIEMLNTDNNSLTKQEIGLLLEPVEVKVLLSIRSDKMSLLDRLKINIPQILQKTFELQPLSIDEAEKALLKPSQADGDFASQPFTYQTETKEKIINYLSDNKQKQIEAFQLQIICQYIENKVIENKLKEILPEHISNLENIFNEYYNSIMSKIADKEQQEKARLLIEEKLIVDERRISLDQLVCEKQVSKEVLQQLVESRLLRLMPNSTNSYSYEVSHDTLIAPILKAKEEKETERELEREREIKREVEKKLKEEEKKRNEIEMELRSLRESINFTEVDYRRIIDYAHDTLKQERCILILGSHFTKYQDNMSLYTAVVNHVLQKKS